MATRSGRNNSGASSSSSSTAPTTLRVVASTVTEPTLNMPTTPAQLTEMIASAVATALTNQQPVNRDLFNTNRKAAILIILKSEDLLTLITEVRSKPIKTSLNPNGYSPRRCITNSKGEEETINSDDEYLYRHDINRLYLAMTICISNEIQFLCPVAIATTCGMTLWAFSNYHLFGTAYKDILIAMDKVRQ